MTILHKTVQEIGGGTQLAEFTIDNAAASRKDTGP
jgi:hypothetical protein